MKFKTLQSVEIKYIKIDIPCRYNDEDILYDFPLRVKDEEGKEYDRWVATVDLETGQIQEWPNGKTGELFMKVRDEGYYHLLTPDGKEIASIEGDYVPSAVPGEFGDYVDLRINEEGIITNWVACPSLEDFK